MMPTQPIVFTREELYKKVWSEPLRTLAKAALVFLTLVMIASCDRETDAPLPCPKPSFSLVPAQDTLAVGATLLLTAPPPSPAPSWQRRLVWSSSASGSVRVDSTGLATGIAPGTAEITALDLASPPTCPDRWSGVLVVR
jgi:hypothetical protein